MLHSKSTRVYTAPVGAPKAKPEVYENSTSPMQGETLLRHCRKQSRLPGPANYEQCSGERVPTSHANSSKGASSTSEDMLEQLEAENILCGEQALTDPAAQHEVADQYRHVTKDVRTGQAVHEGLRTVTSREKIPVAFHLGIAAKAPSQILRNSLIIDSVLLNHRPGEVSKEVGKEEDNLQENAMEHDGQEESLATKSFLSIDNIDAQENVDRSESSAVEGNKRNSQHLAVTNATYSDFSDVTTSSSPITVRQSRTRRFKNLPSLDLTGTGLGRVRPPPNSDNLLLQEESPVLDDGIATCRSSMCLPNHEIEQSYKLNRIQPKTKNNGSRRSEINDEAVCAQCRNKAIGVSFCIACYAAFCDVCWTSQVVHRFGNSIDDGDLHQKTNADEFKLASEVRNVLNIQPSSLREELFRQDAETAWFGVARDEGCMPSFQDYGRYANLVASTRDHASGLNGWRARRSDINASSQRRFPSLVSFVGQTGAGKSSIIKLLIDLECSRPHAFPTPIVGPAGNDAPTSNDVHLYPDPSTIDTNYPLLFADCEGLEAGTREPLAASFKKKALRSNRVKVEATDGDYQEHRYTARRELKWGNDAIYSREFAVTNLYSRLLYTFSDVIVFILKNPRTIESVLEKLVEWTAAALEKSSNQPVLPHVIITLNALDHTDEGLWDVESSTRDLLDKLARCVHDNAIFKRYAQFWRERNRRIETAEDLILSYYSSIKIIRIPNGKRPTKVATQITALRTQIHSVCEVARRNKKMLRMLLDDEELDTYLQFAFDHFASTLDTPFDFVQASFVNSPVPHDFAGNILKLAINMMRLRPKDSAEDLFLDLSYMVASCIMLENARSKLRGTAEDLFPPYFEHVLVALEDFTDRHWPCEYVRPGTRSRCVNVRSGHSSKGHQLANGNILADGSYQSSFNYEDYRPVFEGQVYHRYEKLLKLVGKRQLERPSDPEERIAADIHQRETLCKFFKKASNFRPRSLINHTVCYTCLFEAPEHVLPCGHIICTPCAKLYGSFIGDTITMERCPMEERPRPQSWIIQLKPDAAGTRFLSLDGGGIRGIVELAVLQQIENELENKLSIQTFFDVIIGTSTGGLIALGLGVKRWSVSECHAQFERLCNKAFTRHRADNLPVIGWLIDNHNHSKYKTAPLQEALPEAFSEDVNLFGGRMTAHETSEQT